MKNENDILEKEFEKLSYEEIERVLMKLGTTFKDNIKTIPKQHIFATIEYDYPIEKIKEAIKNLKLF